MVHHRCENKFKPPELKAFLFDYSVLFYFILISCLLLYLIPDSISSKTYSAPLLVNQLVHFHILSIFGVDGTARGGKKTSQQSLVHPAPVGVLSLMTQTCGLT